MRYGKDTGNRRLVDRKEETLVESEKRKKEQRKRKTKKRESARYAEPNLDAIDSALPDKPCTVAKWLNTQSQAD
jgi:hypothetical protein